MGRNMEEDEWVKAAAENDILPVNLIVSFLHPEVYVPWRRLQTMTPSEAAAEMAIAMAPPPAPPMTAKWGSRRPRSRVITVEGIRKAKREAAAMRASPTTPLSWSGGAGGSGTSSGSVCGDGVESSPAATLVAAGKRRRPPSKVSEYGESSRTAAEKKPKIHGFHLSAGKAVKAEFTFEDGDLSLSPAVATGSIKSEVVASAVATEPTQFGRIEPLRLKMPSGGENVVVIKRPAKRKTVPELLVMEKSLLQEKEELQKELVKQQEIYSALLEENSTLRKLTSNLPSQAVDKPSITNALSVETKPEQHHIGAEFQKAEQLVAASVVSEEEMPEQLKASTVEVLSLCFDLNCLPNDNE